MKFDFVWLLPALALASGCLDSGNNCNPVTEPLRGPWSIPLGETVSIRWEAEETGEPHACVKLTQPDGSTLSVTAPSTIRKGSTAAPDADAGDFRLYELQIDIAGGGDWSWSTRTETGTFGGSFAIQKPDTAIEVVVIGDSNGANLVSGATSDALPENGITWNLLQAELAAGVPDVLVHTGDISYQLSVPLDTWAFFFDNYQPMLGQVLFMPAIGNHEYEFAQEFERYVVPWFSFVGETVIRHGDTPDTIQAIPHVLAADTGPMRIITVNSNLDELTDAELDEMWGALDFWLAGAGDRWKTVVFHHPIYTQSLHAPHLEMRDKMLELDAKHDIHLVLNGHNHVYERYETPELHMILSGGGGTFLYGLDVNDPISGVTRVVAERVFHTTRLTVDATQIKITATDLDGNVIDDATIDRR